MKDYENMTQEELEKELAEIIKKNYEQGVVLLDRNYNIKLAKGIKSIHNIDDIYSIITILREMKYIPDLKKHCKSMTDQTVYIHPIVNEYTWKEPIYGDFVSREEFINRTGIFVTPSYFFYIYDVEWKEAKESGISVDDFITGYKDNSGEVMEVPLQGTFKYIVSDEYLSCIGDYEDVYEPNIWEIFNCLARSQAHEYESKWETIEEYKKVLNAVVSNLEKVQLENSTSVIGLPS